MAEHPSSRVDHAVQASIEAVAAAARERFQWLRESVPDGFESTLREDAATLAAVAVDLPRLVTDQEVVVVDREDELTLLRLDVPGSVLRTLKEIEDREISATEIFHSEAPVPGTERLLEVHRYEFAPPLARAAEAAEPPLPPGAREEILAAAAAAQPGRDTQELAAALSLLWAANPRWVRLARPDDVAQLLGLFLDCRARSGFTLELADARAGGASHGAELLFAVASPPARGFLMQLIEALDALDLGTRRLLALSISDAGKRYFLGSFRVAHRKGAPLTRDGALFDRLRRQLCATQILAIESPTYRDFVLTRVMTAEEAALVNAFIGFCHTTCAHNQPERYTHEDVVRAFHFHPDMSLRLVGLFRTRFDPSLPDREAAWRSELAQVEREVAAYNTGHKRLDEFRRSLFRVALLLVKHTLKTNFFVDEKQALAFRLDPAYLDELGAEFTADLPPERPFRVTFFYGRNALGYHVGFADIARGGWRTVFTQSRDDYVTVANRVFRENYVLAHTQHLKNKDIYEGGSKMVVVIQAAPGASGADRDRVLHKVQRAFARAFLDVFVTKDGVARDPRVVDYYRSDEPIELGPDENMHDAMVEEIAALSKRRGYLLGAGIMSSKKVGINHKEYGVTSLGVVTFAAIAMRERGIDIRADRFSVKFTGGPNGDVAGNAMRLLLERCPRAEVRLIVDGTAALVDPRGLDREALRAVVLRADADAFDATRLSPGGVALYRNVRKADGLRQLHRRVEMTAAGLREDWVTVDEFHQEFDHLLFRVPADLFIPAGGRPETIDKENWREFLGPDGAPSAAVVVEGANSFITPEARQRLQEAGVMLLRDASANKCGVISSSYEIIGNLLLDEREFLAEKEVYVRDVLEILERRAADEASLIVRRHREEGGRRDFTRISEALSVEINQLKARLFAYFEAHPELAVRSPWREALLAHLPRLVREHPVYRQRVERLPSKYRSAILAAEIATAIVYRGGFEPDFAETVRAYVARTFGG